MMTVIKKEKKNGRFKKAGREQETIETQKE